MAESDMENAWLYHEIGRCHLELGSFDTAKDYGEKSLGFAEKMEDDHWKLNATVLIAQSEAKMNDVASLQSAIEHFEKAIKIAEKQGKMWF
jgi:tetratricopeptide (TPR) repeat protein